jgi:hypothetical protein
MTSAALGADLVAVLAAALRGLSVSGTTADFGKVVSVLMETVGSMVGGTLGLELLLVAVLLATGLGADTAAAGGILTDAAGAALVGCFVGGGTGVFAAFLDSTGVVGFLSVAFAGLETALTAGFTASLGSAAAFLGTGLLTAALAALMGALLADFTGLLLAACAWAIVAGVFSIGALALLTLPVTRRVNVENSPAFTADLPVFPPVGMCFNFYPPTV